LAAFLFGVAPLGSAFWDAPLLEEAEGQNGGRAERRKGLKTRPRGRKIRQNVDRGGLIFVSVRRDPDPMFSATYEGF
jgi:hypothetical protein